MVEDGTSKDIQGVPLALIQSSSLSRSGSIYLETEPVGGNNLPHLILVKKG